MLTNIIRQRNWDACSSSSPFNRHAKFVKTVYGLLSHSTFSLTKFGKPSPITLMPDEAIIYKTCLIYYTKYNYLLSIRWAINALKHERKRPVHVFRSSTCPNSSTSVMRMRWMFSNPKFSSRRLATCRESINNLRFRSTHFLGIFQRFKIDVSRDFDSNFIINHGINGGS
jgi:hypothetical protein